MGSSRFLVQKFGGTSVGTPDRIRAVARQIAREYVSGNRLIVVVSAMGHSTDALIDLAHELSHDPPRREMDMLLSTGERISMALLSIALSELGVPSLSFTGSQTGIITDSGHRRARIRRVLGDRVRAALESSRVAIVAGFQGVSEEKEITTLGRGGSDTTAVALAATFKADECQIYTDVDGVFSADPRVVPSARRLERLPHDLMIEFAHRGAGVLHPRSVEMARRNQVKLSVLNSLRFDSDTAQGTEIRTLGGDEKMEEFQVIGVTPDRGRALFTVELARPSTLAAIWERSAQSQLSVLTPQFASAGERAWVHFYGETEAISEWKKHLDRMSLDGFIASYKIDESRVPVSLVGYRFTQDGAALSQVLEALAQEQIWVTIAQASSLGITLAIEAHKVDDAVKRLHQQFVERRSDS